MTAPSAFDPAPPSSGGLDLIAPALVAAQAEMTHASKDATNPHFRSDYASLQSVIDATRPVFAKHKLAVVQFLNGPYLVTILLHESGQSIEGRSPIPDSGGNPQKDGSAITYYRRYNLMGLACIAPADDDDGNAAAQSRERKDEDRPPAAQGQSRGPSDPDAVVSTKQANYLYAMASERAQKLGDKSIDAHTILHEIRLELGIDSIQKDLKMGQMDGVLSGIAKWEPPAGGDSPEDPPF